MQSKTRKTIHSNTIIQSSTTITVNVMHNKYMYIEWLIDYSIDLKVNKNNKQFKVKSVGLANVMYDFKCICNIHPPQNVTLTAY